ncbi:hypothetical protein INH39_18075 [Massilia violaceinigra]|uniref:Uncharacterized protein n=1 Tax=Massilia violaceinigra TaxID=2045208 RepID=A0ABY3ZY99_9BURK|nr:hypothetical protein [Massilia violaceinigra]UOD27439.1 hypothetical protein INH39_18075 [Massilia violaceinigra]
MSTTPVTSQASFFQAKKSEAIDNETQRWFYDLDNEFLYGASSFWEKSSPGAPLRTMPLWGEQRSGAFQYLLLVNNIAVVSLSPWSVERRHFRLEEPVIIKTDLPVAGLLSSTMACGWVATQGKASVGIALIEIG